MISYIGFVIKRFLQRASMLSKKDIKYSSTGSVYFILDSFFWYGLVKNVCEHFAYYNGVKKILQTILQY